MLHVKIKINPSFKAQRLLYALQSLILNNSPHHAYGTHVWLCNDPQNVTVIAIFVRISITFFSKPVLSKPGLGLPLMEKRHYWRYIDHGYDHELKKGG
jgi:hypothetical protein